MCNSYSLLLTLLKPVQISTHTLFLPGYLWSASGDILVHTLSLNHLIQILASFLGLSIVYYDQRPYNPTSTCD